MVLFRPGLRREAEPRRYEREFGNEESELMAEAFLSRFAPGVERAERASEWCDQHCGLDLVAYLGNGQRLGVQWTITDAPERQVEKVRRNFKTPFVELHADDDKKTPRGSIPLVTLYADKRIWGEGWNKGEGDPYNAILALENPEKQGMILSCMACDNLEIFSSILKKNLTEKERQTMISAATFLRQAIAAQIPDIKKYAR